MKILKDYVAPSLIILLTLVLMFLFRTVPATKLWNGYTSLYVTSACEPDIVISELNELGCSDIIYLENQNIPLNVSMETPEIALSVSGAEKSDYLEKRNLYFFDKNSRYKIYYIRDKFEKETSDAAERLTAKGWSSGINVNSSYPWLAILICIAYAVLLVFNSEKKILASACEVFPVLFCFSMPFYTTAAGVCLFNSAVFLSLKVWNREGAVKVLYRNIYIVVLSSVSLLVMFLNGFSCGLVFVPVILSVFSVSQLAVKIKEKIDSGYSLKFVSIRSARVLPVITKKSKNCFAFCTIALAGILVFASLSSVIHPVSRHSSAKGLMLPAANGSGNLPDTADYINWCWETRTYPYFSLNEKIEKRNEVHFTEYKEDNNGLIIPVKHELKFNEDFKKESLSSINNLNYPAVEKMLYFQGKKLKPGYVSSSSQTVTILTIIQLIIAMLVPAVFYVLLTGNKAKQEQK